MKPEESVNMIKLDKPSCSRQSIYKLNNKRIYASKNITSEQIIVRYWSGKS